MPTQGSKKALNEFLSESQDIVEALSANLLRLDEQRTSGRVDPEVLNDAFRAAHSLKGLSGMFGIERMSALAHRLEDLMDGLRMGRVELGPDLLDLLFEGIETMTLVIGETSRGEDGSATGGSAQRTQDLSDRIGGYLEGGSAKSETDPLDTIDIAPQVLAVLTEYEEHRLRENVKQGANLYRITASFDLLTFDRDLSDLTGRVRELGEVISTLPSGEGGSESTIDFEVIVGTDRSLEELSAAVASIGVEVTVIARRGESAAPPRSPPQQVGAFAAPADTPEGEAAQEAGRTAAAREDFASIKSVANTVRVDVEKLDGLMTVVGELVLSKTNLQRISEALKEEVGLSSVAMALIKETRNLERRIDALQSGVLEVRMVPLGQIFDKLSRMVRKIARESGKQIDFQVSGGETELDKLIIEELSDPLMHLIRNAIDHGIERPGRRSQQGKDPTGVIRLVAFQSGNHVTIELSDDGAGMSEAAIVDTALRKQLITPEQIRELSDRDILNLIFVPGFSTVSEATEYSGRGVGMDVVKTNVSALSGVIDVQTEVGVGTTFSMTLPITLAIIQALIVRSSTHIFAVPLNGVREILRVSRSEIRSVEGHEVIDLRGATVPLVRLSELFELERERPTLDRSFVVVIGLAQNRVGVAVDELIGQQDVVIKTLGAKLSWVRGISGATDLGDQRTTLVLDIASIIEEVLLGGEPRALTG